MKLLSEGLNDDEVIDKIVQDNLFQYPTEMSVRRMAKNYAKRLHEMNDDSLIRAITI